MESVDTLIYLDSDTLVLSDLSELWEYAKKFNKTQLFGLTNNQESGAKDLWYTKKSRFPFYGKYGLNSGVLLMNLTRLRNFEFEKKIFKIFQKYKKVIKLGDQDLINILFFYFPSKS